jgi:3-oxoacyl-[acyl-carrier protein] reductase
MKIDLSGKTALVCGSTGGIGKAAALQLASCGADVILLARNQSKLNAVLKELSQTGNQKHEAYTADFAIQSQVKEVAAKIASTHQINILVNNTGGPPGGPAHTADIEEYIVAFNNHLVNNHLLVTHLLEGMKKSGYGRIINVISTSVKQPLPNLGVSNTIRGAVANWAKTLANELAGFGITVNNVLPGATETERLASIIQNKADKTGKAQDAVSAEMLKEIPAGRFAKPEETAYAIAFLASPLAAYINGINLPVDGGRTGCL